MVILHVSESFAGGSFEVVRTLAQYQARAGHRVAIAYRVLPETPTPVAAAIGPGIELEELRWKRRRPVATALAARSLRRYARRLRPDVVHLHSAFAGVAGATALAGSFPTAYTPHGESIAITQGSRLRFRLRRAAERFIARRVGLVGAVSETEARRHQEIIGRGHVVVVPNGIPELDEPPGRVQREDARPLAVGMGRMTRARRPLAAGRILGEVAGIADVLWIGGVDHEHGVEVPGLPLTGWLDREQAIAQLARATALVHWSAWDSHPLVVLEGMALDVVVIASDIPANRELLGPEQVFDDEQAAAACLREVLEDPEVRERFLASQHRRRKRFSARRMTDDWLRLYESLRGGAPASSETVVSQTAFHA